MTCIAGLEGMQTKTGYLLVPSLFEPTQVGLSWMFHYGHLLERSTILTNYGITKYFNDF